MPVDAHYAHAFITLRLVGEYSLDELRQSFLDALPSPDARARGLLIDLTQSFSIGTRSAADVRSICEWWGTQAARFGGRMALLADGMVGYGMARLASVTLDSCGITVDVFRDEAEAKRWVSAA